MLFTRVVMRQPINLYRPLRLPGLDPDKFYTDEETGRVYSGAQRCTAGWTSPPMTSPATMGSRGEAFRGKGLKTGFFPGSFSCYNE